MDCEKPFNHYGICCVECDGDQTARISAIIQPPSTREIQSSGISSDIPGLTGKGNLSEKALMSAIDPHLIHEVGIGFRKGAIKHGLNNFRKMKIEAAQGVMDSLERHVNDYKRGILIDPETGVSNLALIVTNCSMLKRLEKIYGAKEVLSQITGGDSEL